MKGAAMKNLLNLDAYEKMTVEECWGKYGWGSEAKEGTIVYHIVVDGIEVFCDEMNENYQDSNETVFGCEIFAGEDMTGQWFAATMEDAIRGAIVDMVGYGALEEGNCEDAVNAAAHDAYTAIFGKTTFDDIDTEQYDNLLGFARDYVKANCKYAGFEWEEF